MNGDSKLDVTVPPTPHAPAFKGPLLQWPQCKHRSRHRDWQVRQQHALGTDPDRTWPHERPRLHRHVSSKPPSLPCSPAFPLFNLLQYPPRKSGKLPCPSRHRLHSGKKIEQPSQTLSYTVARVRVSLPPSCACCFWLKMVKKSESHALGSKSRSMNPDGEVP